MKEELDHSKNSPKDIPLDIIALALDLRALN